MVEISTKADVAIDQFPFYHTGKPQPKTFNAEEKRERRTKEVSVLSTLAATVSEPNTTANSKAKPKTNAEECRRQDEEFLPHRKVTTKDLQRRGKEGAEGKRSI